MIRNLKSAVAIITCSCFFNASAAVPSNIGVVMKPGDMVVDGASVRGNSMLFDGTVVSSGDATSNLKFSDGSSTLLRPGSTIKVFREHAVLSSGIAVEQGPGKRTLVADGLTVSSPNQQAVVLVNVIDGTHFAVSAQSGEAEVRTSSGNLVARVKSGSTGHFMLGASGVDNSAVKLQGTLRQDQSGNYLMTDSQTNVTYQLRGNGLHAMVGSPTAITGAFVGGTPAPSASGVVQVSAVTEAEDGQGGGGASPSASGPGSGFSHATLIFGIFVAIDTLLVILEALGDLGGSSHPVSPVTP
jgi:hypothetical protein